MHDFFNFARVFCSSTNFQFCTGANPVLHSVEVAGWSINLNSPFPLLIFTFLKKGELKNNVFKPFLTKFSPFPPIPPKNKKEETIIIIYIVNFKTFFKLSGGRGKSALLHPSTHVFKPNFRFPLCLGKRGEKQHLFILFLDFLYNYFIDRTLKNMLQCNQKK